jgi:protein SDA1
MTYLAQASHDLVPPEVLEPVVRAVANNFITERNTSDAIAMGLNTVREVCTRCPLVMTRELLADLAGYKTYRDRGVVMAARSLIQLYRKVRPELLPRKDRGQPTEASGRRALEFGEVVAEEYVPGMELVDIPSEQDEDSASDDEVNQQLKRQRVENAISISQSRLLTNDDFQQLRVKQACAHLQPKKGRGRDVNLLATVEEGRGPGELLPEEAITTIHSRLRRSKEERLASSKAGRGKKNFGHKRAKLNPHSSTTNQQKAKSKSFTMMKQKVSIRAKGKRSFRERQIKLRKSLLKQRKK